MNEVKNKKRDYFIVPLSYLIFIPSLYIILTEKPTSNEFKSINAAQALFLWLFYLLIFLAIKTLLFFFGNIEAFSILAISIFWAVAFFTIYTSFLSLFGRTTYIPIISNLATTLQNSSKQAGYNDKK